MHSVSLEPCVMPNDQRVVNGGHHNDASTSAVQSDYLASNVKPELDASYVKVVAETVGISNLSDSCASHIAAYTTFTMKQIIEHARKYTAHGRRKRLIADDFDAALSARGFAPFFGFTVKEGVPLRCVGSLGRDLFVTDERELELSAIVNSSPPKIPLETNVKAHWLVIDGQQPSVPENPTPVLKNEISPANAMNTSNLGAGSSILSGYNKVTRKTEQVQIKTTASHTLSVEQQTYFKEITEAVMGSTDALRTEALQSLQTDAGLQQLLPRFSLTIVEGVRCNIVQHNLAILIYLMRMIQSLTNNQTLNLERCLHDLLPAILSCILSKQLCARPETDNHWALREYSSRLLASLCKAYNIDNVRTRVTHVLTRTLKDKNCSLSSMYGAVYALNELGVDTVRSTIVSRAALLYDELKTTPIEKMNNADKMAADKIQHLVTKVLIHYVRTQKPAGLKDLSDYKNMFGGFGEAVQKGIAAESTSNTSLNNNTLQHQRLSIAPQATPLLNSPRYAVRPQTSSLLRMQNPQSYVNTSLRHQQTPSLINRTTQQNNYYSSSSTNASTPSYIMRPAGMKMIATSARGTSGSASESYRSL